MEPVQLSLTLSCANLESPGRLTAEASAALRKALGALTGGAFELSPYPNQVPDLGLRVMVDSAPAPALPPTAAVATSAGAAAITHCGSWLGEAKALRLGALALSGFALSPRHVLGLTRCMAGLKDLDLHGCTYVVDALPLLTGLPRLEQLRLAVNDWTWPLSVPDSEAIEAAVLSLTAAPPAGGEGGDGGSSAAAGPLAWRRRPPLPLLKSLSVDVDGEQDGGEEWGWLEEALAPARGELARRQPMPAELRVSYRDGDGGGAV